MYDRFLLGRPAHETLVLNSTMLKPTLQTALGLLLALTARAEVSLTALDTAQPVAARIDRIEQFLGERYFDPQGLMYSHINWREERPFTAADFTAEDSTMPGDRKSVV